MDIIRESHMVKTRKDHICHGCCKKIPKGSNASSFTGKDDYIYTIYTCEPCETFINIKENEETVREMMMNEECTEGWIAEFDDYRAFLQVYNSQ